MREKRSESEKMTATPLDEMHDLVRRASGPHAPWKVRVGRAARVLGISFSRAKDFYYRNERASVRADELERARRLAKVAPHDNDFEELRTLLAQLDGVVERLDRVGAGSHAGRARDISRRLRRIADGDR